MTQPSDMRRIVLAGYEVRTFSPWHYKAYHDGMETNIWPTRNKYMRKGWSKAKLYSSIQEVIDSFRTATPYRRKSSYAPPVPTREQAVAYELWNSSLTKIKNNIEIRYQSKNKKNAKI